MTEELGTGRYVYAITRDLDPGSLGGATGLRGAPLDVVEHRGLVAVVSAVDLAEFGEEGLRRNLEDLAWLEEVARGHDDVVHAVAGSGPVAPLRLATIYHDDDGVRARLEEQHEPLAAALDRVTGRHEWSVKAFAPPAEEDRRAPVAAGEARSGAGAGAAYLRRRKEQVEQRHDAEEQALALAGQVHEVLASRAVASRRLQPQDPKLAGHSRTMTLNGAYLVDDAEQEAFVEAVETLAGDHPGAGVSVAGPWPPYSFATLEQP